MFIIQVPDLINLLANEKPIYAGPMAFERHLRYICQVQSSSGLFFNPLLMVLILANSTLNTFTNASYPLHGRLDSTHFRYQMLFCLIFPDREKNELYGFPRSQSPQAFLCDWPKYSYSINILIILTLSKHIHVKIIWMGMSGGCILRN